MSTLREIKQMAIDLAVAIGAYEESLGGDVSPVVLPTPKKVNGADMPKLAEEFKPPINPDPPTPATPTTKPPSIIKGPSKILLEGPIGLPANKAGLTRTDILQAFYPGATEEPKGFWTTPSPRLTHTDSVGTDGLHQRFSVADRPKGSATSWGQMALPLQENVTDATYEMTVRFPLDWEWSKTGKLGGLVGSYGSPWPGGHQGNLDSFSARFTWNSRWWANGGKGDPRLCLYIYGGFDKRTKPQLGALSVDQQQYGGTRMEFVLDPLGVPPLGQDLHLEMRVIMGAPGKGKDAIFTWVNGNEMFGRTDLNLSKRGLINFAYPMFMCGGASPDFGPPSGYTHMYAKKIRVTTPN